MKTSIAQSHSINSPPPSFMERKALLLDELKGIPKQGGIHAFLIDKASHPDDRASYLKENGNKLPGCLYNIWLSTEMSGDKLFIEATSDSKIMKGAIAILIGLLSGLTVEEIIQSDLEFLYEEVLHETLHSTRYNSIRNMEDKIKTSALQLRQKAS